MRVSTFVFVVVGILVLTAVPTAYSQVEFAKGLSIEETLRILTSQDRQDASVELLFKSGSRVSGTPQSCDFKKNTCVLTQSNGSSSVVDVFDISSVTITDPGSAKVALQGGKILRESNDEVLTQLDFKRRLKKLTALKPLAVHASFSDAQLANQDCRFYAMKILDAFEKEIESAKQDTLGAEALAKKSQGARVVPKEGVDLAVRGAGPEIVLEFDCQKPLVSNYRQIISRGLSDSLT